MIRTYRYIGLALVVLFLSSVARFYHRGTGFTALIGFPAGHQNESAAMRAIPHYEYPAWASYDGQFYAQRALDPLLRDPEVDRGMDLAPFRARRILFSWTAYAAGLGRPAWILEAYALQNVVCWLALAALLTTWLPLSSARGLALWTAILFSHGLLWSVRFSLLDGPSLLLIACSVLAVERGRTLLAAAISGVAALGRETNVLSIVAQPWPSGLRAWLRLAVALVLAALPLMIWYDYLRSIYRSTLFAGTNQLVLPGVGLAASWDRSIELVQAAGLASPSGASLCLLIALAVQGVYIAIRRDYASPWWRIAAAYVALMLVLDPVLANPHTGAITRVLLPLTAGFNILLAREPRTLPFWLWFAAGNLHLVGVWKVMPIFG